MTKRLLKAWAEVDDDMHGRLDVCFACGDPATGKYSGKWVCFECAEELLFDIIRNQNIHFVGGTPSTMEDDSGPWSQNAIRHMEDG